MRLSSFALLLIAASGPGCAGLRGGKMGPGLMPDGKVLFDVDFTRGNAGPGQVTGGKFEGGWRVTSRDGQRIVFDAGHPVEAGYLEVSFTMNKPPHGKTKEKVNWAGLYEDPGLNHGTAEGDKFIARVGEPEYQFSRVKAFGRKFDKDEWENDVGAESDWVTNDKKVMTVRFEWKGGKAIFHDPMRRLHACGKKICGGKYPIDALRYVFLGSDNYTNISLEGIRFTHAKLVEYVPGIR